MHPDRRFPLLEQIQAPADLRRLPRNRLPELAAELRAFLIESVARTGGHLAANLGVVELTLALHYVYQTPEDRLVWDVGHQSYPHKILTGRREAMAHLRQAGGISGFPRRSESPYDTFGVGHSSTSISAALGMAIASRRSGSDRRVVAVIGDGAMTAGMAFEALNHAGDAGTDLLVVLNDNEMSISRNVGGLANHFARLLSGRLYTSVREGGKHVLEHMPGQVRELARRAEEHMKGMVAPSALFEELGFNYIGPIDGHDLDTLVPTLRNMRDLKGPQILHVVTRKGCGFEPAEADPCAYHGVGRFNPRSAGQPAKVPAAGERPTAPTWTRVFGEWLLDAAARDPRMVAITPAMCTGSGMDAFAKAWPERFFDVGIAEQHAVTLAAGMAAEGQRPVVAIYSSFLQRAYDQLIHDVALQDLPVLFAIDRAGLVGADGPTHAGAFDLSFLRCVPNMVVMAPADARDCRAMLDLGLELAGPAAVRYPRGAAPAGRGAMEPVGLGRGRVLRRGTRCALLNFGSLLERAAAAAETLGATLADMRFVKPLDESLVLELAAGHELILTLEDNVVAGGAGSAVSELLAARGVPARIVHLGLPDRFVEHDDRERQLDDCGLAPQAICEHARTALAAADCSPAADRVISY